MNEILSILHEDCEKRETQSSKTVVVFFPYYKQVLSHSQVNATNAVHDAEFHFFVM